jgi:hypothetical protein
LGFWSNGPAEAFGSGCAGRLDLIGEAAPSFTRLFESAVNASDLHRAP